MTATFLFSIIPTKIEAFVVSQNKLLYSRFIAMCVLQLQPPYHSCLHLIITLKYAATKITLYSGKEMAVTWCQIRDICLMFEDFLLEALQKLSSHVGTVQPSVVMQRQNTFSKEHRTFSFNSST